MDDGRWTTEDRKLEIRKEKRGNRLKAKGSGQKVHKDIGNSIEERG